ncbi:hypothetical protein BDL97_18G067600 [Sphagnum fallax]|nr:hypothetical protein BDL97_18G067600 [Sphagnum fallax]
MLLQGPAASERASEQRRFVMASHARAPLGSISTCASRSPTGRSQAVAAEVLLLQSHSLVQFCSRINRLRSSRICRLLLRGAQQAGGRQTRIESRQHSSSSSSSSSLSSSSRQARIESRLPSSSSWCRGRNDVGFFLQARCIDLSKEEEVCEVEETPFLLQRSYVDGLESSAAVDVDVGRQRNEIGYAQGEEVLAQFLNGNFGGLAAAVVVLGLAYSYGFWNVDSAAAAATTERVSLDADMRALALGPGGPLMEEFWDNVRRYGFYFFTVVTGEERVGSGMLSASLWQLVH